MRQRTRISDLGQFPYVVKAALILLLFLEISSLLRVKITALEFGMNN
jgi:hypothetical protein